MKFWNSVFSEPGGMGSFARVASGFVILCVMGWLTWWAIQDVDKFLKILEGSLIFMTTSVLNLYGLNKTATKWAERQANLSSAPQATGLPVKSAEQPSTSSPGPDLTAIN